MGFLHCRSVGDSSYNSADSTIDCDERFFKRTVVPLSSSIVIIIGLIIPLSLWYKLFQLKKKNRLDSLSV